MFEWNDGNVNSADRRGLFVSLVNGNKLSVGGSNVIGVVSSSPVVIGDAAELSWHGKYERDEFGGIVYQTIDGMRRPKPSSSNLHPNTNLYSAKNEKGMGAYRFGRKASC